MLTSKQRAYLRGRANDYDTIFQVGKGGINENMLEQIDNALEARELIKISVLKNCMDDPGEIAQMLAERTSSEIIHVMGKKIVLYKENKEKAKKQAEKTNARKW